MDRTEQLRHLLEPLLSASLRLPDEAWLPATVLALGQPMEWVAVFSDFDAAKQEILLNIFTGNGANMYTDVLLLLLVEQPAADADSVAMLTHLARGAADRHRDRLAWMDGKIAELSSPMAADFSGRQKEYAARLLDLQQRIEQRAAENPRAWQLINQEMEIARLEWKLDQVARAVRNVGAERDTLQSSVTALETQISALKTEKERFAGRRVELTLERDTLLAPIEQQRSELQQLEHEVAALRNERQAMQTACEKARENLENAQLEIAANRLETEKLTAEQRRLRDAATTVKGQLQEARNALSELQAAPEMGQMAKLQTKLAELWKLLPADDASAKL